MKPIIDFEECLKDSPKFRSTLEDQESDIEALEMKLDKVLKSCGTMIDAGKIFVTQQNLFVNSLWDLSTYFRDDTDVIVCMNKLIHAFQEMHKFHAILLDQASRTILKNLTSFIKNDIKSVKESKHCFDKISNDLDAALVKNSSIPKSRPTEAEDSSNMLCATRSCFRHTALDYVHTISIIQAKKRYEILGTLLSYMHACNTFFHQGTDLCQDLDPFFKKLEKEVDSMRKESGKLEKEMENRHMFVNSHDVVTSGNGTSSNMIRMEGYLFKRTSNAFKTWNRRWFMLHDTKLVYRKRSGEDPGTIMEEDLRLCTVKPVTEGERRYCFEVLSPSKSHVLQADSEEMLQLWIDALQRGIGAALQRSLSEHENSPCGNDKSSGTCSIGASSIGENRPNSESLSSSKGPERSRSLNSGSNPGSRTRLYKQLLKIPGNDHCCDCNHPEPRWCSINLGITLCIECSGVHRSLGVHYSKVRSLTLDDWDKQPEILKVMAELGNSIVNKVYEANVPSNGIARATPNCSSNIREAWIKAKYLERRFVKQLSPLPSPSNLSTSSGVQESDLSLPRSARPISVRKWSVRKLRRRPRSTDAKRDKINITKDNKESEEAEDSGIEKAEKETNKEEVFLFGQNLDKQPLEESLDLSSDQDSTGGEDNEDEIGQEDISNLRPDLLLYKAAAAHNLPVMCQALALGADKFWTNPDDHDRSPLHQAIQSGSVMACEYLILNGAKINCQDNEGKTPLYLATELGHTAQAALLLKHKADQHIKDHEGIGPLAIAVRQVNADIVTLLRLSELNDQIRASEQGSTGDDTFHDVVRDFSQLAYTHPERLSRTGGGSDSSSH